MKILITGGTGLIGKNLTEELIKTDHEIVSIGSADYDLTNLSATNDLLWRVKPDILIHLAAQVGGIQANIRGKYQFYLRNTQINTNVVDAAYRYGVKRIIAAGTGCAYPSRLVGDVLHEDDFLDGVPEETNDSYAYSKRNMLVHLRALKEQYGVGYVYMIPANIYGPCFSDDTQVLTQSGFKNIKDFKKGDKIYTLNPETHEVEITKVTMTQKYHTDELFKFKSKSVDFLVSPEHKIYGRTSTDFQLKPAEWFRKRIGRPYGMIRLARHKVYNKTSNASSYPEEFSMHPFIDSDHIVKDNKVRDYTHPHSKPFPIQYKSEDMIEFMGWFITEGCITQSFPKYRTHGQIIISQDIQANPEYYNQIVNLLTRMGIPFGHSKFGCFFTSRLFSNFITQEIGNGSGVKHLPKFVFDDAFPMAWRKLLFDTLMKGDGHKHGRRYSTKSETLKDDMLHLCFLLGHRAQARFYDQCWRVNIQTGNRNPSVKYKDISIRKTDADVFCITTQKNHIVYAGRNGTFNWIGQCDNFNPEECHVVPGLISRFHRAKVDRANSIDIWGTGEAARDFLYIDDCVEAIKMLLETESVEGVFNIASGKSVTIRRLVSVIKEQIGFHGGIIYDLSRPDGQKIRIMDTHKMEDLGWKPRTSLEVGIEKTINWFKSSMWVR